jgi:hypothetical protein
MAFEDIAALHLRMRRLDAGARDTVRPHSLAVVIKAPSSTVSELSLNRENLCSAIISCIHSIPAPRAIHVRFIAIFKRALKAPAQ